MNIVWRIILMVVIIGYILYYFSNLKDKKFDKCLLLYMSGFLAWLWLLKNTW